jgi:putative ABC transport system ATP-binding protein
MQDGAVLEVRGVSKIYRRGRIEVYALRDVSLTLDAGSALAIMGPSGAGKTTLLNVLAGLDTPTAGEVYVGGRRLDRLDAEAATVFRRRQIGFVFQFFNLLPALTAAENVGLPLLAERLPRREMAARAHTALAQVGLAERAEHRPDELSGGEQQRVAIARALVLEPRLILADEPTGNLDTATGAQIVALLRSLVKERGLALLAVTHADVVARACDRILEIRDGRLLAPAGSTEEAGPWASPQPPS